MQIPEALTNAADPEPDDDLVVAWRAASDEALRAYDAWRDAKRDTRSDAYCVYLAAADREAAAAEALYRLAAEGSPPAQRAA
jgi:hypothetical protein